MNQFEQKIATIETKIKDFETERTNSERALREDRELLRQSLAAQELGELSSSGSIEKLKVAIRKREDRIGEIEGTITALRIRRVEEEKKSASFKMDALKADLKKVDLGFYRVLREMLIHKKELKRLEGLLRPLDEKRRELIGQYNTISPEQIPMDFCPPDWINFKADDSTKTMRSVSGIQPQDDLETPAGAKFLDEKIIKLQAETK